MLELIVNRLIKETRLTESKQLANLFERLSKDKKVSLLDFAEFLSQKDKSVERENFTTPTLLPRGKGETVITAIKRLKKSYSMLNMDTLLNETSTFMAQYMVQGRDVNEVIDDLEDAFEKHYQKQKQEYEND